MDRNSERILDEYLVAAAIAGDRDAVSRLVARWQPRFFRHAWRLTGDAERAKDMVQEAWMEILRGMGGLHDVAAFPAWSYRIVSRRCQRAFNRSAREPLDSEDSVDTTILTVPERESAEFATDLSTVVRAISTLPRPQQAALALFYIEGLGVAEIALALDVPLGTVKTRLMHARQKVRAFLEGDSRG